MTLATSIYSLCLLTSAGCAWLLIRGYFRTGSRLLLWSAVCFFFLAINNFLVVIDLVVLPTTIDLSIIRQLFALLAISILLVAFVSELD